MKTVYQLALLGGLASTTSVAFGQDLIHAASGSLLPDAPSASRSLEQSTANPPQDPPAGQDATEQVSLKGTPLRILRDELAVVTSPARIRTHDLVWLLPLAGATAASLATDTRAMRDVVTHDAAVNSSASTASDALRGAFIGAPVLMFVGGQLLKNDRAREAGLLAGEAMVDSYVAGEAIKYITLRERPNLHAAGGSFFSGDAISDPSFPSGHSVVAWSSAAVLAGEYSRPWQQVGIYTLAAGASFTRVLAQQHFPTDALIGSAAGWMIGHYVYRKHHRALK